MTIVHSHMRHQYRVTYMWNGCIISSINISSLYRVTQFDLLRLSQLDGLGTWREQEASDLSSLVQKRLHTLQNPPDCEKARKLVCNLNKVSNNTWNNGIVKYITVNLRVRMFGVLRLQRQVYTINRKCCPQGCGYGCQIHHVVYCLIVAYGSKRTLILKSRGWRYNKAGWEDVFHPLSDTCTDPSGYSHSHWPGK